MAKNPINRDSLKKLLDTVTPMNPDAAERFVREVMRIGDERRRDAERLMNEVTTAGRRSAELFATAVQQEVAKQLGRVVLRIDALERQIEHLNRNVEATRTVVATAASKAVSRAKQSSSSSTSTSDTAGKSGSKTKSAPKSSGKTAKNAAAKKSSAKKSGAKSSGSKKASVKKSGSKSGASKKANAGSTGETSSAS